MNALAGLLADGTWAHGQWWRVARAWPAVLDDPHQGYVLELAGEDGRVRGARLADGTVEFPQDEALPALAPLMREGWTVLAHRLGKRAVLRRDGAGAYRKLATKKATERAVARTDTVDHLLAALPTVPRPPDRVGVDIRSGILDLAPAPGVPVREVLTDPATEQGRARTIGRGIGEVVAAMGTLGPDAAGEMRLPVHGPSDEVAVIKRWVTAACALAPLPPEVAARLRDDADAVIAALLSAPEQPRVLAHRDLHDGQILVEEGGGITMLDWDTASWTDPCLDAANLLAHFDLLEVHRPDATQRVAAAADGLLEVLAAEGHPSARNPEQLGLWRRASAVRIAAVHAFRGVRAR